ncbi:hypothetical protein GGI43DRAFT_211803 [Trichoderma evansii]
MSQCERSTTSLLVLPVYAYFVFLCIARTTAQMIPPASNHMHVQSVHVCTNQRTLRWPKRETEITYYCCTNKTLSRGNEKTTVIMPRTEIHSAKWVLMTTRSGQTPHDDPDLQPHVCCLHMTSPLPGLIYKSRKVHADATKTTLAPAPL